MPVDMPVDVQRADTAADSRSGSWRPWVNQLASGRFARPVAVYIAAHVALIAGIGFLLAQAHRSLILALQGGDSGWYESIASHGYERQLVWLSPGVPAQMRLEFFPGLPLMIRLASDVTGASLSGAGLLVSLVASLVAAAGIYAVVARYASDAVALVTVALWAAMPAAFLESMVYTEALFAAFAVWALYALLRDRWLTAAWLTVGAGLTRASAATLIAIVCLACLIGAIRNRGRLRAILAMLIAPAGFAGYLLYIGLRVHNLHAWFISVRAPGWNSHVDFGRYTFGMLKWIAEVRGGTSATAVSYDMVGAFLIVAVAVACVVVLSRRVPVELRAWTGLTVLFILGSDNGWFAVPRYLLPLFPLFVPAAEVIVRTSRRNQVIMGATVILLAAWWGAYFLRTPGMGL